MRCSIIICTVEVERLAIRNWPNTQLMVEIAETPRHAFHRNGGGNSLLALAKLICAAQISATQTTGRCAH